MRSTLVRGVVTAIILVVGLGACMIAASAGLLNTTARVWAYIIANAVLLLDMVDLVTRVWVTHRPNSPVAGPSVDLGIAGISQAERAALLRPYAIVVAVQDASDTIDRFTAVLEPFKDLVWLVDNASSDDTVSRLCRSGWNCIAGGSRRNKSGALYHLIKLLPPQIETILVLDPHVEWSGGTAWRRETLDRVVSDLQRSGAAAATPRIRSCGSGWLQECQAFEYELYGALIRKSLGYLCSNAGASVYRRSALEAVLALHTLSGHGAELENSLLLLATGEVIYYDDRLAFDYPAERTWNGWFAQRIARSFGGAKVWMERIPLVMAIARRRPLGAYHYAFYLGVGGYLLLPLKLASLGILAASLSNGLDDLSTLEWVSAHSWNDPVLFALWYLNTVVLLIIAGTTALPRGEWLRHLPSIAFYPFYVLLQLLPSTIGVVDLLTLRVFRRRIHARGDHDPGYGREPAPGKLPPLRPAPELIA